MNLGWLILSFFIYTQLLGLIHNFDSTAYANCFTERAVVFDEDKTHLGKKAIKNWIAKANETYTTMMKPLAYSETQQTLKAEISGTFPGSPLILTYQFKLEEGRIQSLKII